MPPPESFSVDPRRTERFVPVPDPHLNSMPSVFARSRIEDIESCTALMKQAEHWGLLYPVFPNSTSFVSEFQCQLPPVFSGSSAAHPTLKNTGELNATF